MALYNWDNCPLPTQEQINTFIDMVKGQLNNNLIGIYLHGSLSMNCFNPERSDIDLIVVIANQIEISKKKKIIEELILQSNNPHPIEVSFIVQEDLKEWKYPTPYDLHYSEYWRNAYIKELSNGQWALWNNKKDTDSDLAAHFAIIEQRGIILHGQPIPEIFLNVPKEDYTHSILLDFYDAIDGILQKPIYGILNSIRVYAYLIENQILSKEEAGKWALNKLPEQYKQLIGEALNFYENDNIVVFDQKKLLSFKEYINKEVSGFQR